MKQKLYLYLIKYALYLRAAFMLNIILYFFINIINMMYELYELNMMLYIPEPNLIVEELMMEPSIPKEKLDILNPKKDNEILGSMDTKMLQHIFETYYTTFDNNPINDDNFDSYENYQNQKPIITTLEDTLAIMDENSFQFLAEQGPRVLEQLYQRTHGYELTSLEALEIAKDLVREKVKATVFTSDITDYILPNSKVSIYLDILFSKCDIASYPNKTIHKLFVLAMISYNYSLILA